MAMIYSPGVAGLTGQVQFNNSGVLGADNSLFWDNTNKRLGINNNSPSAQLSLVNSLASQAGISVRSATSQTANIWETRDSSGNITSYFNPFLPTGSTFLKFQGPAWSLNAPFFNGTLLNISAGSQTILSLFKETGASDESILRLTSANNVTYADFKVAGFVFQLIKSGVILFSSAGSNTAMIPVPLEIGSQTQTSTQSLLVSARSNTNIGVVVRSFPSPSVNIQEWQNSSGVTKASVTKDFELQTTTGSGAPTTTPADGATYVDTTNHRFYVRSGGTWKYTNLI